MKNTAPFVAQKASPSEWLGGVRIVPNPHTRDRRLKAIQSILREGTLGLILQAYPDASGVPLHCGWIRDSRYRRTQGFSRDDRYALTFRVEGCNYIPVPDQDLAEKEATLIKAILQGFDHEGDTEGDEHLTLSL